MTLDLYPCPYCGQKPDVKRTLGRGGVEWTAECWCAVAYAKDEEELRHRWNDLYCADDPATVEDCE